MSLKAMTLRIALNAKGNAPQKIAQTGTAAKGAAGGLAAMGAAASAALGPIIAITAAFAAFAIAFSFIKRAITLAIEFEDIMGRTQAVTGASAEQMAMAEKEIRALGASTRFTATEVAKAAQVMAIAGISFEEMVSDKALERVLQLAEVGGVDIPTAAGIAVAAIKGFRLEMEDLGRVNDVLAYTMTRTNVTLNTLGEAMKYLGPTAAATGVSLEESAAAIGALGNAGIAGTLAGTQLRGALNKLVSPGEDARRTMQKLGLDIFKLTPAGDAAQMTLRNVAVDLDRTKFAAKQSAAELKALTREMAGMSLDQQRNNLRIMAIKRKAEKQGRDLTESELQTISRLESANSDLELSMAKTGIQRAEAKMESDNLKDSQRLLQAQFSTLNKEVNSQVMGVTSLVDVMEQLQSSGATTAQIMEIFGIRGGGAILALLGQHEGFVTLVDDLNNSGGAAEEMAKIIGGTTAAQIATMKSALDEVFIAIGQEFLPILRDELIPMFRDDFIPLLKAMIPIIKLALQIITPLVEALAEVLESYQKLDERLGRAPGTSLLNAMTPGMPGPFFGLGSLLLADGGLVTQPTQAIVGEAGPEVVIPLDQFKQWMRPFQDNARSITKESGNVDSMQGITISNIHVHGVLNADDVGNVIAGALPQALNRAIGRNARGAGV